MQCVVASKSIYASYPFNETDVNFILKYLKTSGTCLCMLACSNVRTLLPEAPV